MEKFLLAKEMLDQGDPEKMKTWVNTELGETWEEPGERLEDTELVNRREVYDAQVPEDVLVLTAGVDVQDDRFEVEVVGWGVGKESWGIRYQKIYGDMLKEQVWRDLDAFLTATFSKKDGTQLPILCTCIDSGGHHTDQVYRFTKERYERAHLRHQRQGRPGGAVHPQPVHEQPREDAAVRFGRRRGKGAGVSAPQARAAGAEGAELLPLPAERGGRIRRAILPGPDQREGRGAVPQGAERDGMGDQGRELQAERAA